jgi:hypothetical protein
VAEGARGRRWRWTVAAGDGLRHAALIELDGLGRFARLELETLSGMLTLHPDPDRSHAHGNVVRRDGVEPVVVAWSDDTAIAIDGDPFGTAVAGWLGSGWVIGTDLAIRSAVGAPTVEALDVMPVDDRGVPRLADPREWPLEA